MSEPSPTRLLHDRHSPFGRGVISSTDRLLHLAASAGPEAEVREALLDALEAMDLGRRVVRLEAAGTNTARYRLAGNPVEGARAAVVDALLGTASAAIVARAGKADNELDPLTGALGRVALDRRIDEQLARAARDSGPLMCAMVDVDAFKAFNDTLGYAAGDAVLRCVARAMCATVRPFDVVGRFGGDEFVLLLEGVSRLEAPAAAARVLDAIRSATREVVGREVSCTMGLALAAAGTTRLELLQDADAALQTAKRSSAGSWELAGPRLVSVAVGGGAPAGASEDLRAALQGRTSVHFQPIVGLDGGDGPLAGFEALTRGPGTLARPDQLLDHARRVGQLVALDEELHRRAFSAAAEQGLRSPLSLFVNVEPETLARIIDDDRFWRRTSARFASISEITERALLDRPGALLRACTRLRELGWGVALDDVDTDSRALALLPLIAPDVIKLDLNVTQRDDDDGQAEVMMAVSAQRHHGGARLLAEGIETEDHRQRALAMGADYGQGYLLGRPRPTIPDITRPVAAVPRTLSPPLLREITPFQLLSAERPSRRGTTRHVDSVQRVFERRASALGARAAVICSIGAIDVATTVRPRLIELAETVGMSGLIGPSRDGDAAPPRLHEIEMDDEDPRQDEWTTVLLCAEHSAVLSARRVETADDQWQFSLDHDREFALAIAYDLVARLP